MRHLGRLLPRLEALLILYYAFQMIRPIWDPDTFLHIATGRLVWQGTIPHTDPFSHTIHGKEWLAHEWLAAAAFYGLHQLGGLGLIGWVVAATGALTYVLLLKLYDQVGVQSTLARCLTLVVANEFTGGVVHARPHLVTLVCLVLTSLALNWHRQSGRILPLCLLPPMFTIWANCHGGFILGGIPFLAAGVDALLQLRAGDPSARRRFIQVFVAGWIALAFCAINPQGFKLLLFPFGFRPGTRFLQLVMEWQIPSLDNARNKWLLMMGFIVACSLWPPPLTGDLAALAAVLFLCVQALRNQFLFGVFGTPILAQSLQTAFSGPGRLGRLDRWLARSPGRLSTPLIVGIAAVAVLPWCLKREWIDPHWFPRGVAEWMNKNRPPGPLFNDYNHGGFLIWELRDSYQVFVDGRIDVYQRHGQFRDYRTIAELLPGWDRILDRHRINLVLNNETSRIVTALNQSPNWKVAYVQDGFVLLERSPPLPPPGKGAGAR